MINAKTASLTALCVHYATLTLCIHASRVHTDEEARYKASSAVLLTEAGKLLISLCLALGDLSEGQAGNSTEEPSSPLLRQSTGILPSGFGLGIIEEPSSPQKITKGALSKSRRRATSESHSLTSSHSRSTSLKLVPGSPDVETRRTTYATPGRASEDHQLCDVTLNIDSSFSSAASTSSVATKLRQQVFGPKFYRLAIPAGLFAIQGNLQYLAVSNLSVPTFQVISQLKILTTAIFSVILLHRRLSVQQWLSLLLLAVGVSIVQVSSLRSSDPPPLQSYSASNSTLTPHFEPQMSSMNSSLGLTAVSLMCLSSGFASTYFEKILKSLSPVLPALPFHSPSEKNLQESYSRPPALTPIDMPAAEEVQPVGLWVRNVQLSMFGLFFSGLLCAVESSKEVWLGWVNGNSSFGVQEAPALVSKGGFLEGFTAMTWFVVALQIIGGLIAALVMKHADNIQKNFATSLSIILSFAASILFFNFVLVIDIVLGSALVIGSTFMFNAKNQDLMSYVGLTSPRE